MESSGIQDSWIHITGKCIFCDAKDSSKIRRLLNFTDKLPAFKLKIPKDDQT